jgi:hypothetical protein
LNNIEAFYSHFQRKCEALIKTTRLFEHIFRKMMALIKYLSLFQTL